MGIAFKKAVKYEAKARVAIAGPSGSGKTFTSLVLAGSLADGKRIAVLDTERGSASKYADIFDFDVVELENFHPDNFVEVIHEAEKEDYGVLVIDSLTHAWNGTGGVLEIAGSAGKGSDKNTFTSGWGKATPLQNKLIDAITRVNMHIICTMRSKTEYVLEKSESGKMIPTKVGMAPVQRADLEYEFDVYGELDIDHCLRIQKSRCNDLSGCIIPNPDEGVAEILKEWLNGVALPDRDPQQEMRRLLDEFYAISPALYARITDWELQAIKKALDIANDEDIPTTYTHLDVSRMMRYVSSKRQEKLQKTS